MLETDIAETVASLTADTKGNRWQPDGHQALIAEIYRDLPILAAIKRLDDEAVLGCRCVAMAV